jgi:predicted O-methyltransferase YrrM
MIKFGTDESVKIDQAHAELLKGLIVSHKPKTVLELGVGGGQGTDAMLSALEYNQQASEYTLVDNWHDFKFKQPPEVTERYGDRIEIVTCNEREYVFGCSKTFDFIMSDADHHRTDQWFEHVYNNLLNEGGILVYHDINLVDADAFHNLVNIYRDCKRLQLSHFLFNKNSRSDERCQRGLLVIFKNNAS